jgi:hypothetical protein
MLKKCLKYDLKAVFRIWWIAAVSVLGLAVVCGFCTRRMVLNTDPNNMMIMESMAVVSSVVAAIAFSILSTILLIVRYYTNFFKDEGYLTFTLPVKRQTLFLSKIISSVIVNFATAAVIGLGVCLVLLMTPCAGNRVSGLFFMPLELDKSAPNMLIALIVAYGENIVASIEQLGFLFWIYVLEVCALVFLGLLMQTLLIYFCMTIGATVAKKQKILASIGIYYGSNMVISLVQQLGFFAMLAWAVSGLAMNAEKLEGLVQDEAFFMILPLAALLLLIWILFYAIVSTILGFASLGTLERKLNLQ